MRKRTSKRRWKARLLLGRWIPLEAILDHRLEAMIVDGRVERDWPRAFYRLSGVR